MKRHLIGVIADTHDNLANLTAAFDEFGRRGVALVIHCGDWKSRATVELTAELAERHGLSVRGVMGNNDMFEIGDGVISPRLTLSPHDIVLPDLHVAACHGHHKPTLRRLMNDEAMRVVLVGHSHKPRIEYVNDKLIVNPGSTAFSIPRSKTWRPSIAIVDVVAVKAEHVFVV